MLFTIYVFPLLGRVGGSDSYNIHALLTYKTSRLCLSIKYSPFPRPLKHSLYALSIKYSPYPSPLKHSLCTGPQSSPCTSPHGIHFMLATHYSLHTSHYNYCPVQQPLYTISVFAWFSTFYYLLYLPPLPNLSPPPLPPSLSNFPVILVGK